MKLKDQVAIITGATSGIGRSIAMKFAHEGAKVAVLGRSAQRAEAVVTEIQAAGGRALALICDIRNKEEVKNTVTTIIDKWQNINILVNNAGIGKDAGLLENNGIEVLREVLEVDLVGAFQVTEVVVKKAVAAKWPLNIINITSVHSEIPVAHGAQYPVAKAGLKAATKSWALELAQYGIRVNAVAPGAIKNTGMNKDVDDQNEAQKLQTINIPLNRFGEPEDIAKAIIFLATNSYITGQEIVIDGGLSLL